MEDSVKYFLADGLSEETMAERTGALHHHLSTSHKTYVDIVEILEFKIPDIVPGFRLVIRRDVEMNKPAKIVIKPPRIYVKETVYDYACEGDSECRRILCHELGHLLLHVKIEGEMHISNDEYKEQFPNLNAIENTEDQADIFARHFMIAPHVAYRMRSNPKELAKKTGTPLWLAKSAITISKRQEMYSLRSRNSLEP